MGFLIALAARWVGGTLAPFVVWGIIGAIGLAVGAALWQTQVRGPYIAQGEARATEKLTPKIKLAEQERDAARAQLANVIEDRDKLLAVNDKLKGDVDTFREIVRNQTQAIDRLMEANRTLRAAATKAAIAADQAAAEAAATIGRLQALASGPAIADAARQAETILSDLADYVRAHP